MFLPEPFVLIDVETTGANPVSDRITEIAVLRVEHGQVVARWETLVNPQRRIPPMIERIIGITNDMVATAPTFAQLADGVRGLLEGAVFVAHNARFDYGFICNEYTRIAQRFDAQVLCTVKLSRALYPDHHRHGLDALIERHGLHCDARHRAMGDAEVLWQFARLVSERFPPDALAHACTRAMKLPARPAGLPEGVLEGLPDTPGVYQFFGENDAPLFVGRSMCLRARVTEYFALSGRRGREAELARQVRRLEWRETAGELSALLHEAELLRTQPPAGKRRLRAASEVFGLRLLPGRKRAPIFEYVTIGGTDPAEWADVYGAFRSSKEADNVLRELADLYRLCPRRLGLEPGGKDPCLAHRMSRCAGVCAGREHPAAHDHRLLGGLRAVGPKDWPWPGPVVVFERSAGAGIEAYHLLDRWCHLGSADSAVSLDRLVVALPQRRFDVDVGRILQRWLAVEANRAHVRVLERP